MQELDLYACVRPVRYYQNVPSPLKEPEKVDVVIFRENTEDVYAGLGVKPISPFESKRLVRMALQYAIDHQWESVNLVHKGNIMKYDEGAFRNWGYELAKEEFADQTVTEE